jgi:phage terminase large subunit-like protein
MSILVDYSQAVADGSIEDPTFSGFVYSIPDEMDVFEESTWPLANPALDDFRSLDDMRTLAERAKRMPTMEATFRNLFCNQRVDAEERWIPAPEWLACQSEDVDLDALAGARCYGALDLGSVRDLTSFALFFPDSGVLRVWSWCPADNLREREDTDRVPYTVWAEKGFIEPTPGRATDKRRVAIRIAELCERHRPTAVAFDLWGITELERVLSEEGLSLPLEKWGQGYKSMSPATKAFEERVLNRRIVHSGNPLLTWAISNVSLERDAAGNIKPSKERSRERIDPAVASVMAVGVAATQAPPTEYSFSGPGVISA